MTLRSEIAQVFPANLTGFLKTLPLVIYFVIMLFSVL